MRWDIFCRVIDNFGDAGVCWRLARQLVDRHGQAVTLWIDHLQVLQALAPQLNPGLAVQSSDGVTVSLWTQQAPSRCEAQVVVEAFACELPDDYLRTMSELSRPPVWLNLEYLSAEDWVESCHELSSINPINGLKKIFYFPGFKGKTGGILWGENRKNAGALPLSVSVANQPVPVEQTCLQIGFFTYDTVPLDRVVSLLKAWSESNVPLTCLVPPGKPRQLINRALQHLQLSTLDADGAVLPWGQLTLQAIPFLSQDDYDTLLTQCDLNFVRGEDSFVRALWAAKPMIWQIYPQEDGAHIPKLDAFLEVYLSTAPESIRQFATACHRFWNGMPVDISGSELWANYLDHSEAWQTHARNWAQQRSQASDLAENLVKFCAQRV